jgi:hypothetical protein
MRIFDLHTSKAKYELKVVLLHFWRVNVKTISGFINIPLPDLSYINLCHNHITILQVSSDSISYLFWQRSFQSPDGADFLKQVANT